jgi:hypothetical protein
MQGFGHADVLTVLQMPGNEAGAVPCERIEKLKEIVVHNERDLVSPRGAIFDDMERKTIHSKSNTVVNYRTPRLEFALMALLGLLACSVLIGCAMGPDRSSADPPDPDTPNLVYFLDSASFDNKLYKMLAEAPSSVTVKFPQTVTLNEIPKRLDRWFYKVEKFDGEVNLEVDPNFSSKGIITELYAIVIGMYVIVREKAMYDPVKNYNATIFYIPGTGEISRLVFSHKQSDN